MQEFIVAIVVSIAVISLLKRYMPPAALAAVLRAVGLAKWALRLEAKTAASGSAGCSSGCSGCSAAAPKPQTRQFTVSLESLRRTAHK